MRYLPTGKQMQDADLYTIKQIGIPSLVLMERAALQVVEKMEAEDLDLSKVLVVCGSGNNGGDGYAIARLLFLKGHSVEIYFAGNEASRSVENRKQKKIADFYKIPIAETISDKDYSVIVDSIFGTGLKRNIEGKYFEVIQELNRMAGLKVAVDIPSGIHDATGKVMGIAFCADMTVAIAFAKRGMMLYPGAEYAGKVLIGEIGITEHALSKEEILTYHFEKEDISKIFPKRRADSHKGMYGKVLLIVGSKGMSGAAYLCAKAAYSVGAGLVQIYTSEDNRVILQQLLPEAIFSTYNEFDKTQLVQLLQWADVVGIGCGLGKNKVSEQLVQYTLKHVSCPCIVDADAINILSEQTEWMKNIKENMIFTPHMKEMTRLLNCSVKELAEERFDRLCAFAKQYPAVFVLKDSRTLVAKCNEKVYLNLTGNAAMAKAGAGDVLAGMITGIAAQKTETYMAACLGVYLHGLAGDAARDKKGKYSVFASDIIEGVSEILKNI